MKRFLSDRRGTSVIELAMVAPVVAAMALGAGDLVVGFTVKLEAEQAALRATELASARRPPDNRYSDLAYIKSEAETAGGAGSSATVEAWLECDGTVQSDYTADCATGELYGRYVSVTVAKEYETNLPYNAIASIAGLSSIPERFEVEGVSTVRIQ